jgi:hypothetical protein
MNRANNAPTGNVTAPEITRARAEEIALAALAREMIGCEVHEALPVGYTGYALPTPPESCWWVVCGPVTRNMLDGPPKSLLCVSRRTGRILARSEVRDGG